MSFKNLASATDVKQAYAVGEAAVKLALEGKTSVMPTIVRVTEEPYTWEVGVANLSDVANVEKFFPRDYITPDGFGISELGRKYLLPLIQGEDYPPYKDGMPDYVQLVHKLVDKKLGSFEV